MPNGLATINTLGINNEAKWCLIDVATHFKVIRRYTIKAIHTLQKYGATGDFGVL